MKHKGLIVAAAVVAVIAVVGVVSHQPQRQYRTGVEGICHVTSANACNTSLLVTESLESPGESPTADIHLGFLEFDDQGDLWSRDDAVRVFDHVASLAEAGPVTIVVFAHGWQHGAAPGDTDIENFRAMLRSLGDAEAQFIRASPTTPRTIVGVYLGWRGRTFSSWLTYGTFWTRKNVAHRVGTDGVHEALDRLSAIRHSGDAERNRLVLIGHSFGGALMYAASAHALMASLEDVAAGRPQQFADLVVIVNAAVEAQRFDALIRRDRELAPRLAGTPPLLLAVTSTDDKATGLAFPAGRWLSTTFETYRDNSQKDADRTTIGHFRPFVTHVLAPCEMQDAWAALAECPDAAPTQPLDPETYRQRFRDTAVHWYGDRLPGTGWQVTFPTAVLHEVADRPSGVIMNVMTPRSLVVGHSGIWGSPLMLFVRDLVGMSHVQQALREGAAGTHTE